VPVTASVLARLGPGTGSGPSELAWTSAVPPLQAPALLADAGFGVGRRGELALATRGKATSVQIEPVAPAGAVAPRPFTAQVPESGSVVVRLPPPATAGGTYAVRIVPSGGDAGVWAAGLTWEEPPGLRLGSIVPVRASVGDVVVPEVAADLDVGVRRG
jgi:hypothetical protein